MSDFPRTTAVVQHGIDRSLHTGVQIYVSVAGQPVLDAGVGLAEANQPMTASTVMLWRSAGKPLTAAAVLRLCEQGRAGLDTTLRDILPETRRTAISRVSIRELLTHTSGIPIIDTGWPHSTWSESLDRILQVNSFVPGSAYQPQSTWFLLGEILQRLDPDHRLFRSIIAEDLLAPIGIDEAWCGIEEGQMAGLVDRLPRFSVSERGEVSMTDFSTGPWLTQPSPGGNFRGPVRELGRFYETLLNKGRGPSGETMLRPETVMNMTSAQRTDRFDDTMQHVVDLGLGLFLDSKRHGQKSVPYGFGKYCSAETFGHGGAQCAMGFCDPAHKLVVAWAANGICSEPQHQRRNRTMNEAIYEDLDLFK